MPTWTKEQQQAIELRGKSLLVAAAAGSGKTAVLVERIIQIISDTVHPVDLDRLLVVTFTNAAAAEMKERIGAAIQKQLLENPMSEHLYRQSLLLSKTQITTLHSFCLDLVRQNFFRLGLDPQMKIADETENQLLLGETLDDLLEEYYSREEGQAEFIALVDCYGGREDEQLRAVLLELYEMSQSMARPQHWLKQLEAASSKDWFALAAPDVARQLRGAKHLLMQAIQLAGTDEGLQKYFFHIEQEYNWSCELLAALAEGWDALAEKLRSGKFESLPRTKKGAFDEEIKAQVVSCRDSAKKLIEGLREGYFSRSRDEQLQELASQRWVYRLLVKLTLQLSERFQQKKAEKGIMDFHDMEHFCFQLLYEETAEGVELSELAMELKQQYYEVMVDEYQDVNDLQEAILQGVSREENLFMVGDVKQSIYGFRMANPQLFSEKYQSFSSEGQAQKQRLDLNRNFRCRRNIVDGVNTVFAELMTGENGDLLYDEQAALVYGADYPAPLEGQGDIPEQIQLLVLTQPEEEAEETAEQPLSAMEEEGLLLCQQMQQLMQEKALVYDKRLQQYRRATWRDIVVLLRAPKAAGTVYARILKEAGIPAVVDTGDGYFSAWEIQIILSVLHIIDNPLQDLPLLAVLKAPFFHFEEEELAQLRLLVPRGYFYHCLEQGAQECESPQIAQDLQCKVKVFLKRLERWRSLARQMDLSKLIWQLYKDTGFYEYVGALREGVQRQANLRALYERARTYEKTSFKGVFLFLRFLEQLEKNQADLEPARILSDNENVVRIMSIHKSKGLEFPVVFLGGIGRRFNFRDAQQEFLLDKNYGLAFSVVDEELQIKYRTIVQQVIAQKKREALLQEEKRILYVAMTRARERLYLIGSCGEPEKRGQMMGKDARCYLDWLLPMELKEPLWQVQYVPVGTVMLQEREEQLATPLCERVEVGKTLPTSGKWRQAIAQQLDWQYPQPALCTVKAQSSVTELKQRFNPHTAGVPLQFNFDSRPEAVIAKEGLTSAEKGTLLHLILNKVDLTAQIDAAYLEGLLKELESKKFIAAGSADGLPLQGILDFFQGPLGQRFLAAKDEERYRELPFIVALDSHALEESLPEGSKNVLVQGVIDCLWREEDGWVLVDYKSDHVGKRQTHLILERYSGQIQLYRYAVEQILGEPVKECYFYLVSLGMIVPA